MTRVTRSRRIDIAEDTPALAIETPLPETPSYQLALNDISNDVGVNNMAAEASPVASSVPSHIKQLKAAYRDAIGTKKNKNSRNKKKDGVQPDYEDVKEEMNTVVNDENVHQGQESGFDLSVSVPDSGLVTLLDTLTIQNLASPNVALEQQKPTQSGTGRVTRRQLAQQQAGQYILSDFIGVQQLDLSFGKD
jgi:hypothetical protein